MLKPVNLLVVGSLLLALPAISLAGESDKVNPPSTPTTIRASVGKLPTVAQADRGRQAWEEKLGSAKRRVSNAKKTIIFGVAGGLALTLIGGTRTNDDLEGATTNLALVAAGPAIIGASGLIGALNYSRGKNEVIALEAEGRAKGYIAGHARPAFQVAWNLGF